MALRQNLPLSDMEFIQFHPTGVQGSQHWRGFIRTRGTRDAGNGVSEHNPERRRRMEIGRL